MADQPTPDEEQGTELKAEADEVRQEVEDQVNNVSESLANARREINDAVHDLRSELGQAEAPSTVQRWVEEHPVLSVTLAVGAGVLVGRLLAQALKPAPPPPLHVRARRQVEQAAHDVRRRTGEAGSQLARAAERRSREVARATEAAGRQWSDRAAHAGKEWADRAEHWLDTVADEAAAVGKQVSRQAADLGESLAAQTEAYARQLGERAADEGARARRAVDRTVDHARHEVDDAVSTSARWFDDLGEALMGVIRTALAAAVVQKVVGWIRR